jgi:hypothetical protein
VGDVNNDGFDDIMFTAHYNSENEPWCGQVYLVFGKASNWTMNTDLSTANASFLGENENDNLGNLPRGHGDINGDGFDDIIIGSEENDEGSSNAGQTYIIFGKTSGWTMDTDILSADATFIGEWITDYSGRNIDIVGDVNSDGYDDFLIGAHYSNKGKNDGGQAYLIFGKASGWSKDTSLAKADVSFLGENVKDCLGFLVEGAGDVNGDGFDDMLIGTIDNDEYLNDSGQVYLILGRGTGWAKYLDISTANASFHGEEVGDKLCWPSTGVGDVNGDGFDDILIASQWNDEGGNESGQAYLVFPELNYLPTNIDTLKAYANDNFSKEISIGDLGEEVYIELSGSDGNSTRKDTTFVYVTNSESSPKSIKLSLLETGMNSGIYRGSFRISNRSNDALRSIQAVLDENITITSTQDPTKSITLLVSTPVQLRPIVDNVLAIEDEKYYAKYWAYGYNTVTIWDFVSNASWLTWDSIEHIISGIPDNGDVGTYWVQLTVNDKFGNFDAHNFTIKVQNTIPRILNPDVEATLEDNPYMVDYQSDDEGLGRTFWYLETNAFWLDLNPTNGEIKGTPGNDDVGKYWVNVSIKDGHGGLNSTNFTLSVIDQNDAPVIITKEISYTYEDSLYSIDFDAMDIDDDAIFYWYLATNGSWLKINRTSGVLSGIPKNSDVGTCFVNVTAFDLRSNHSYRNFTLEVLNVNDPPDWIDVPTNAAVKEGELFVFDVNATDMDVGDAVTFNISSSPKSNISIDPSTGLIEWYADIKNTLEDLEIYQITLLATDNDETIKFKFDLTVIPNPRPKSNLIAPADDYLVKADDFELTWIGIDDENESLTYDVYLSSDLHSIINLLESARVQYKYNLETYTPMGLEPGKIYYWTVIPNDGNSYGSCLDGIFRFTVNTPPIIPDIPMLSAMAGSKFKYKVLVSDYESGLDSNLVYNLENAPAGMSIDHNSGIITWTPTRDQVGKYVVNLIVSDGLDFTNTTLEIEVSEEKEEESFGFLLALVSIMIIFILTMIVVFIIFRKRTKHYPTITNGVDPRISPPGNGRFEQPDSGSKPVNKISRLDDYNNQFYPGPPNMASSTQISNYNQSSIQQSLTTVIEKPKLSYSNLQTFTSKLVGRNDEFNELHQIVNNVKLGNGGTVLLSGETGIGKTSMVNEFKIQAVGQGFQFLSGNCLQESQTPFYPFFEAFRYGKLSNLFMDEPPKIEAMILMTIEGKTIGKVIRDETKFDLELFSSILKIVGDFLRESLSKLTGTEPEGGFNTLGYKNYQILMERGDHTNLVVILTGKENEFLIEDIKDVHTKINDRYNITSETLTELQEYSDESHIAGIIDQLSSLIVSGKYDGPSTKLDDPQVRISTAGKKCPDGFVPRGPTMGGPIIIGTDALYRPNRQTKSYPDPRHLS